MKEKILAWRRLFRVVNLPTVPGDVLVGAAAMIALSPRAVASGEAPVLTSVVVASVASVFLYMYGLADNDLVGASTDKGRPIPDGLVSPLAARIARGLCWLAVLACGFVARLPLEWWAVSLALLVAIAFYNRTKLSVLMGFCRGANVLCGVAALSPRVIAADSSRWSHLGTKGALAAFAAAALWLVYIAAVTRYSEGEDQDEAKRRRVGFLVGAIVYLQLAALIAFTFISPAVKPLLIAGAVLLVVLRLSKRMLPKVSAS